MFWKPKRTVKELGNCFCFGGGFTEKLKKGTGIYIYLLPLTAIVQLLFFSKFNIFFVFNKRSGALLSSLTFYDYIASSGQVVGYVSLTDGSFKVKSGRQCWWCIVLTSIYPETNEIWRNVDHMGNNFFWISTGKGETQSSMGYCSLHDIS